MVVVVVEVVVVVVVVVVVFTHTHTLPFKTGIHLVPFSASRWPGGQAQTAGGTPRGRGGTPGMAVMLGGACSPEEAWGAWGWITHIDPATWVEHWADVPQGEPRAV